MEERSRPHYYFADNPSPYPTSSANMPPMQEEPTARVPTPSQPSTRQGSSGPEFQNSWMPDARPHLHMFPSLLQLDVSKVVAESGVPVSTLRAWEYRYNIPPSRTPDNIYKVYSWRDVAALRWLRTQIASGLTVRQAIAELARLEPAYLFSRGTNPQIFALPPFHDLHDLHDPLLRAITLRDEQGIERLLSDAFAMHPVLPVCQQLLLPVLQKLIELRQQGTLPLETEILAVQVTQAQTINLIEAGIAPRDAQRILAALPLQAARAVDLLHNARLGQAQANDYGPLETQLLQALIQMNEREAQRLLDQAFLNDTVEQVCMNLLQAVLYRIGTLWEQKQISGTIEHFATVLVRMRLAALLQATPDVGQGPLIIIGCAPKETHELGALMLALFWRRAGFHITYLGQMIETKSLLTEIGKLNPGIVCLSAMTRPRVRDLASAAHAIAKLPPPRPRFCFGGGAFSRDARLVNRVEGTYLGTNAIAATERLRELVRQAT